MADVIEFPLTGAGDDTALAAVRDEGADGVIQLVEQGVLYPHDEILAAVALAAGANADLDATAITAAKTGRLLAVDVGATVPLRVDIQLVNGSRVTRTTVYTRAGDTREWRPPAPQFFELLGDGSACFGLSVTNLSPHLTADARAVVYWDEVS